MYLFLFVEREREKERGREREKCVTIQLTKSLLVMTQSKDIWMMKIINDILIFNFLHFVEYFSNAIRFNRQRNKVRSKKKGNKIMFTTVIFQNDCIINCGSWNSYQIYPIRVISLQITDSINSPFYTSNNRLFIILWYFLLKFNIRSSLVL